MQKRGRRDWPVAIRAVLFGLLMALVIGLLLGLQWLPTKRVALEIGDIAHQDIRAPRRVTYVSEIATERARQRAVAQVTPVYTPPDARIARQQVERARQVLAYIDSVRHDEYASPQEKMAAIAAIPDLTLSPETISRTLTLDDAAWQEVAAEVIYVVDRAMRTEIREDRLAQARRMVPTLISLDLSDEQASIVSELAVNFIRPNSFYDAEQTEERKRQAQEEVSPVTRTIEKGQIILRDGDSVTAEALEALDALGLRQPRTEWPDVASALLFGLLIAGIFTLYLLYFHRKLWTQPRQLVLLWLLVGIAVLGARIVVVPGDDIRSFLFPAATAAMLVTILLDAQVAVVASFLLSLVIGHIAGDSLELVMYTFAGSFVAILGLRRLDRLSKLFWAGLYVMGINVLVQIIFQLLSGEYDMMRIATLLATSAINGGLSAGLALPGFYVLGRLFDITTTLQLLELARPTEPLLQQLLLRAPGTYHHSILVANMAEQAAERIGADALLARVGAFYHDIGKTLRPYFFIDNQREGVNVHDRLDPHTSAQIIISHVKDGLDLAKKYRLPRKVRDFIPQHQGTGLVSYFYNKALEEAKEGEIVDEKDFRYPGPKPQSKEAAIVMLADACESTVRAVRPSSPEEIDQLVRKIITDRLLQGELDDSDLTLRDLEEIRDVFVKILQGVFHPRIRYPEERQEESQGGK